MAKKEIKSKSTYHEKIACSSCRNVTDWKEAIPVPIELTALNKYLSGGFLYLCPKCFGQWPVNYKHGADITHSEEEGVQ